MTKEYLGDSVYVDIDAPTGGILLTTENGYGASNIIVLEPAVVVKLVEYFERMVLLGNKELVPRSVK